MDDSLAEFLIERKCCLSELSLYCSDEIYNKYVSKYKNVFNSNKILQFELRKDIPIELISKDPLLLAYIGYYDQSEKKSNLCLRYRDFLTLNYVEEINMFFKYTKEILGFYKEVSEDVYIENKHKVDKTMLKYYDQLFSTYDELNDSLYIVMGMDAFYHPVTVIFNKKLSNVQKYKLIKRLKFPYKIAKEK